MDKLQLDRRKRGLERFINYVYNHPVLCKDKILSDFLTVKMEIQEYRLGQTQMEEESPLEALSVLQAQLPGDLEMRFLRFQESLAFLHQRKNDMLSNLLGLYETLQTESLHWTSISRVVASLTEHLDCFQKECIECPKLNLKYGQLSAGFQKVSRLVDGQVRLFFESLQDSLAIFWMAPSNVLDNKSKLCKLTRIFL